MFISVSQVILRNPLRNTALFSTNLRKDNTTTPTIGIFYTQQNYLNIQFPIQIVESIPSRQCITNFTAVYDIYQLPRTFEETKTNWVNNKKVETIHGKAIKVFERRKRKGAHQDIGFVGIIPPYFENKPCNKDTSIR